MRAASRPHGPARTIGTMSTTTPVIALDHPAALDVARVGRKAADLAAARAAGLPVAPGVVLTTDWATDDRATAPRSGASRPTTAPAPSSCARRQSAATVASAASAAPSSSATIVLDLDAMLTAVAALRAGDAATPVLLQPHLAGPWQGVLFADGGTQGWRAASLAVARRDGGAVTGSPSSTTPGRVRDVVSAEPTEGPSVEVLTRSAVSPIGWPRRSTGRTTWSGSPTPPDDCSCCVSGPSCDSAPTPSAGAGAPPNAPVRSGRGLGVAARPHLEPVFAGGPRGRRLRCVSGVVDRGAPAGGSRAVAAPVTSAGPDQGGPAATRGRHGAHEGSGRGRHRGRQRHRAGAGQPVGGRRAARRAGRRPGGRAGDRESRGRGARRRRVDRPDRRQQGGGRAGPRCRHARAVRGRARRVQQRRRRRRVPIPGSGRSARGSG